MPPRAEDLLDSSCYSKLHSTYNNISPYPLPPQQLHLSSYSIPMNPNCSQVQAQVLPGVGLVRFSQPQHQQCGAPTTHGHIAPSESSLPFYLPPSQPVLHLSSVSSDNQDLEYSPTSNRAHGHEAQGYYYGFQGVNFPAPSPQYQPQPGYSFPYQPQPEYNITSFPFIPIQPTILPQPEPQTHYPVVSINRPQSFINTGPNAQRCVQNPCVAETATAPTTHRDGRHQAMSHVEPTPAAVVHDEVGFGGEVHSTPVLQWMSSGRFHDDDRQMYMKDIVPMLKQELALDISQSTTLANTVFPTDSFPFPVSDSLLEHLAQHGIWDMVLNV